MTWWRNRHVSHPGTVPGPKLAIVGGGFSGTVLLANLVDRVSPGAVIELFDARGKFGAGTAYATQDDNHLLNVPAIKMGAFTPDHFWRWLETKVGLEALTRFCPGRTVKPTDYLPRAIYGLYLKDILQTALARAAARGVSVALTKANVVDASERGAGLEVTLEHDGSTQRRRFDILVLATGNIARRMPASLPHQLLQSQRYIADFWNFPPYRLERLSSGKVLILGTGLTAVDAVLTLERHGFKGKIIALSRHGQLPFAHSATQDIWDWVVNPEPIAPTALAFLHWLKHEVRQARAAGIDWRVVIDALRPITQFLWQQYAPEEQVKLLRRHTLWSIHRHRMAPEVHARIDALKQQTRLEIVAGRIVSATTRLGGFRVDLRRRGSRSTETLRPVLVLNCTGPEYDIAKTGDRFLSNLASKSLILRAPNGVGIAVDPHGVVRGVGLGRIFAMGTLLVGDSFECTAVPELREQARRLADQIVEARVPRPALEAAN